MTRPRLRTCAKTCRGRLARECRGRPGRGSTRQREHPRGQDALGTRGRDARDTRKAVFTDVLSPGFTLLEVMLALVLSIALVGGMLGLYDHATGIRRSVIDYTERVTSARIVMDRMTNELRGAMAYPFLNFGMEGGGGQIEFITASLPGPAVWAVRKSTEDPIPPETDLEMVGYRIRTHEDEDGFIVADGLARTSQKILAAPTAEEGSEIDSVLLAGHVKFLRLAYFDGEQWSNQWNEGGLPLAVEITIGLEPLPEDTEPQDYPFQTFRRTVYVPGGKNSRRGTIIRGLGGRRGRP